jgi:predicted HicB family RNase H-like nuclease
MEYKGYIGKAVYDAEARLFHGDVVGLRAVITFQGKTIDEIEQAFKDSIDIYIDWCKERKVEPETSFAGNTRGY